MRPIGDRIPTLVFYATGVPHWRRVIADTLAGSLRLTPKHVPPWLLRFRRIRSLVEEEYRVLSYMLDWRDAFRDAPSLDVRLCNITNLLEYAAGLRRVKRAAVIVILHSAAGDNLNLLNRARGWFQSRRGKLVLFFGNEYCGMPSKIGFAQAVGADYIATQLPLPAAEWLYNECDASRVLPAPPALNPRVYFPRSGPRPIDLGFRGDRYCSPALGDRERTEIIQQVSDQARRWGLAVDIQYQRMPREQWSEFLNRCHGVIGAESGTAFLERDDRTQRAVATFLAQHPEAGFEEVYGRFFMNYPRPVSGKAISSRHFEAIGTKTCQLLLDGHYNGILKADEHFISVKKDYSNLDEALRRFRDAEFRRSLVERAHAYVMDSHTYGHRVQELLQVVGGSSAE